MIEGGLARHVRKLAEELVRQGVEVDVLTRGAARALAGGPERWRAWRRQRAPRARAQLAARSGPLRGLGGAHEQDMLPPAKRWRRSASYELVHGHDWLVASACATLAERLGVPVPDDHPRDRARAPPGLGGRSRRSPTSTRVERWMAGRADSRDHLLALHARPRGRHLRHRRGAHHGDPQRDRPARPASGGRSGGAAPRVRAAPRAAGAAGGPARLREGLSARAGRAARA